MWLPSALHSPAQHPGAIARFVPMVQILVTFSLLTSGILNCRNCIMKAWCLTSSLSSHIIVFLYLNVHFSFNSQNIIHNRGGPLSWPERQSLLSQTFHRKIYSSHLSSVWLWNLVELFRKAQNFIYVLTMEVYNNPLIMIFEIPDAIPWS